MKKQLLSILIFVLSIKIAVAQTGTVNLRGKILTADGQPAWGLTLSIKNSKNVAYTDREGTFRISAPAGNSVLVIKSGVSSQGKEVAINANADKELEEITIKEKSYELNEVVVTGQYGPQSMKDAVYKVRSISAEKIKLRAPTNIQQILNTEFGFRFTNDLTLGVSNVEMMGMSGRNVKILLDGVPLVDRSDLKEGLNQIDINTVERIEIVEGPMSVVYGTDALAGVINIITKGKTGYKFRVTARMQEETAGDEYEALDGLGSHNKNISVNWQNNGWSAMAGFSNNTFGGWNLPDKTATSAEVGNPNYIFWKPKDQYLGNVRVGYGNNKFNIWYRADYVNEDIISRGGINPNYTVVTQKYTTDRLNNQLHADWTLNNKLSITMVGGYTDLRRKTTTTLYDFATAKESLTTGAGEQDIAKFNAALFRGTLQYKLSNKVSVQPGVEINREGASGQRIKGSPVINDYAVFASAEIIPLSGLKLRPGVRFINNSVYDAPVAVPSLNAMINLDSDLDLRLGYGRGFRAPALRELYFDFFDASHSIMGNENLKAEKSNSFDASLTWNAIRREGFQLNSTLSGFYNSFFDRIEYGQYADDASVTTLINVSRYKTTGLSLDNTLNYKNLQVNFGLSYIGRFNQLTEDEFQEQVPEFSWTPEFFGNLIYTVTKLKGSVSLAFKHTGSRPSYQLSSTNPQPQLVKIGSFTWTDLLFNKTINKYLTLNAGVKNLFDVTQLTNTSVASGGAHSSGGGTVPYSYGRSYVLGLAFNWNKL
ncbi:TonB-dependent receptor [Pedobacter xixiisoli]|uniref:Outer membrane receptor for ferrienterochelin and colicins n=1 Tax=Pedobacter xixiisoli TaxID=1476464 RepID=A0A286A9Z6_9SPHI|nr:TonB-dependent receptor [Pedobacter xixiisoli]SOD18740.1 outer membrane receptor for ferrienterochelin and colicins [Pedobacter xixiisoli]